jgi:hypothetical protein
MFVIGCRHGTLQLRCETCEHDNDCDEFRKECGITNFIVVD